MRTQILADLLVKSGSKTLYEQAAAKGIKNDFYALVMLYTGRFPDEEIEPTLIKKLYSVAFTDGEPLRRSIVAAMRDVGTEAVLPTLRAIAHDLEPNARVRKEFGGALGLVERLSGEARYDFLKNVLIAIEEIERRAEQNPVGRSTAVLDDAQSPEEATTNAQMYRESAEKYLGSAPEIVIFYVRKGAEALAKDVYRHLGLEKESRPARKMMLEELITQLKQVKRNPAPDLLHAFLQTFQAFGNFGSHDQDGEDVHLTNEIAEPIFGLYCQALIFYEKWRGQTQNNTNDNQ